MEKIAEFLSKRLNRKIHLSRYNPGDGVRWQFNVSRADGSNLESFSMPHGHWKTRDFGPYAEGIADCLEAVERVEREAKNSDPNGYIDIKGPEGERASTLKMDGSFLWVMGNLPHGYEFTPKTREDRDRLVGWLNSLEF